MCCVFVWVFRLMCLCVVSVDSCSLLYGVLLCVLVLSMFVCAFNARALFENVFGGVV